MPFILFPLILIAVIVYVGWHVWVLLPLGGWWKTLVIALGIASFLTLFLDLGRRLDAYSLPMARVLYEIGTSSVVILLYLVLLFIVLDLGRLVHLVPRAWLFQNGVSAVCCLMLIFGIFLYGNIHYNNKVRVPLDLQTDKPLSKDYKIVLLSDLHLGYHNPRSALAKWIDLVNAEQPDLVLIAGDIIDISVRPLIEERMAEEFRRLNAPVYACLGNHEYYSGEPRAKEFYHEAGIHLLSDASAIVDSSLVIIGRDDRTNLRRKSVADLVSAATTAHRDCFTILLDHQPYNLEKSEQAGIDFQLSGHTHRGQVWPISWITDAIYECSWGSHQRGQTHYYVSSGIGIWGGKFRIGTQSEYAVLTLKRS